ncbi:MAG: hypothetical protein RML56_14745 [Burkholderiales bacterium]|nr:hypothetical protein [Burkholderiales bacterium]
MDHAPPGGFERLRAREHVHHLEGLDRGDALRGARESFGRLQTVGVYNFGSRRNIARLRAPGKEPET